MGPGLGQERGFSQSQRRFVLVLDSVVLFLLLDLFRQLGSERAKVDQVVASGRQVVVLCARLLLTEETVAQWERNVFQRNILATVHFVDLRHQLGVPVDDPIPNPFNLNPILAGNFMGVQDLKTKRQQQSQHTCNTGLAHEAPQRSPTKKPPQK